MPLYPAAQIDQRKAAQPAPPLQVKRQWNLAGQLRPAERRRALGDPVVVKPAQHKPVADARVPIFERAAAREPVVVRRVPVVVRRVPVVDTRVPFVDTRVPVVERPEPVATRRVSNGKPPVQHPPAVVRPRRLSLAASRLLRLRGVEFGAKQPRPGRRKQWTVRSENGTQFIVGKHVAEGGFGYVKPALNGAGEVVASKVITLSPPASAGKRNRSPVDLVATELQILRKMDPALKVIVTEAAGKTKVHIFSTLAQGDLAQANRALRGRPAAERKRARARAVADIATDLHRLQGLRTDTGGIGYKHRDIKPANILVGTDGIARLGDFGLAHPLSASDGCIAGTPSFMAPEDRLGRPHRGAGDVWSLGATAVECLTGRPFLTSSEKARVMPALRSYRKLALSEQYQAIQRHFAVPIQRAVREIATTYGPEAASVIRQCFQADPRRRPAPADVARAFETAGIGGRTALKGLGIGGKFDRAAQALRD